MDILFESSASTFPVVNNWMPSYIAMSIVHRKTIKNTRLLAANSMSKRKQRQIVWTSSCVRSIVALYVNMHTLHTFLIYMPFLFHTKPTRWIVAIHSPLSCRCLFILQHTDNTPYTYSPQSHSDGAPYTTNRLRTLSAALCYRKNRKKSQTNFVCSEKWFWTSCVCGVRAPALNIYLSIHIVLIKKWLNFWVNANGVSNHTSDEHMRQKKSTKTTWLNYFWCTEFRAKSLSSSDK